VLLQVLDDGRLTDGQGRTVDFKNTIIIMTSNLGAEFLTLLGENDEVESVREQVLGVVRASFRPEFLNRVDEIILFHRLHRKEMGAIVDIQLERLAKLLVERKIVLELGADARAWLADKGYDPVYGARPLKRAIQRHIQDPLSERILSGDFPDGSKILVSAGSDRLVFSANTSNAAQEAA
jgi:ATP-dependent Clp protease ATP-binding subunit ClpB